MSGLPPWKSTRKQREISPAQYKSLTLERDVKAAIKQICDNKDWKIVKVIQGVMSTPGAPDLFIGANRKWYAVEVKRSKKEKLRPDQLKFQIDCDRLGLTYLVIYDAIQLLHRIEGTADSNWGRGAQFKRKSEAGGPRSEKDARDVGCNAPSFPAASFCPHDPAMPHVDQVSLVHDERGHVEDYECKLCGKRWTVVTADCGGCWRE